jgi:hypothetical protein
MFPNDFPDVVEERVERGVELLAVASQLFQADCGRLVALVGEVVGAAREAVDDLDRPAQSRRQEKRGDGKIFVVFDRHGSKKRKNGAGIIR